MCVCLMAYVYFVNISNSEGSVLLEKYVHCAVNRDILWLCFHDERQPQKGPVALLGDLKSDVDLDLKIIYSGGF